MKNKSGFTIVELLIVIVVIAILALITIVTYNGIQKRAMATAITQQFRETDKSYKLWALEQGFSRWPYDNCAGCGTNIEDNIQSTTQPFDTLKKYIQKAPSLSGFGNEPWAYDNDNVSGTADDKTQCSSTENLKLTGVNLYIRWIKGSQEDIAKMVNDNIDGGNEGSTWESCGLVRYFRSTTRTEAQGTGVLLYSLSYTKDIKE